jgi:uncharacterized delta-60 repeat protein
MDRRACIAGVASALGGLATLSAALATTLAVPGQLDGAFGANGKVLTDAGGADWAGSVAVAPGNALVVAGGHDNDVAVARYDAAGRLDAGFGGAGIVLTDLGGADAAGAVVVASDGKTVVAGQRDGDLALVRYSRDGMLDPSFDGDGVVVTDLGFEERSVAASRAQGGRVVVIGTAADRLVLARYLRDGRLDPDFGRNGTVVTSTPGLDWRTAAFGRDGTIVVAGARVVARPTQAMGLAVARYRSDGRLDRTFAGDGLTVTKARPHWAGAVEVAVRRDGRTVLGTHGHAGLDRAGFALVRLRRDGALDRTFGTGGISVSEVGYGVHALALDRQGRIVTVGRTTSLSDFVAARFHRDGRRDRGFAATVADFGGIDTPFAVTIQRDGRIVAVGASSTSGSLVGDIALARYLASS